MEVSLTVTLYNSPTSQHGTFVMKYFFILILWNITLQQIFIFIITLLLQCVTFIKLLAIIRFLVSVSSTKKTEF